MVAGFNNGRNNPPLAGKDYLMHMHYDCTDTTRIKGLEKNKWIVMNFLDVIGTLRL